MQCIAFFPCYDQLIMIKYMTSNSLKEGVVLAHISERRMEEKAEGRAPEAERAASWCSAYTRSSHSFRLNLFYYVCMFGCAHACRYPQRPEEGVISAVGAAVVSHLVWVLGTELL